MSPFERLFWQRLQRRVASLEPEIARAILKAFAAIRETMTDQAFADLIARGDAFGVSRLLNDEVLERAFAPVRQALYNQTVDSVVYWGKDIPKAQGLGVQFNVLNPRMIDAIRRLDTKVVQELKTDVRAVVQQVVERGLREGVNPRAMARDLRKVVGLGASQEQQVANFRQALIDRDAAKVRTYLLRDKRFDKRIARGDYTDADIEKWTEIYRKRRIAQNAETNARTAALDSQKAAQRMSWESAIERGIVKREDLMKRWAGTLDARERPSHLAMEGETVQFDERFSNGQDLPGDTEYNCRCLAMYSTRYKRQPARGVVGSLAETLRARQAVNI